MSDELVVLEYRALRLPEHVGQALCLRSQQQRAIGATLDDRIEAGELRLGQSYVLGSCGHEQIVAGEHGAAPGALGAWTTVSE